MSVFSKNKKVVFIRSFVLIKQYKLFTKGPRYGTIKHPMEREIGSCMSKKQPKKVDSAQVKRYYVPETSELVFVNAETGEVVDRPAPSERHFDGRHFWKLYMSEFLNVLDQLEGRQIKVLIHVLKHTRQTDNSFSGTYRSISRQCGLSLDTVRRAMLSLQKNGFLLKVQNGSYLVSPNILMKGDEHKRRRLEIQFKVAEKESNFRKIVENKD